MTCPIVILPPSAAVGIEARSKIERQALFHIAGRGLWARNGAVVRLRPVLGSLILALAASRGRTLAYGAAIDAVHGDDPEGGPLDPIGSFNVQRTFHRDDFAALGIEIGVWHGCGYALVVRPLGFRGKRRQPPILPLGPEPFWAHRARFMFVRGATTEAIALTVGRSTRNVCAILRGGYKPRRGGPRSSTSIEARRRAELRKLARVEAAENGVSAENFYARWGCQTIDRSRLWDQRRAAAQQDRHP